MKMNLPIVLSALLLTTPAAAQNSDTMKGRGNYGCIHEADYKKTNEYLTANDEEGFKAFLGLAITMDVCTLFQDGESVVILKRGVFTSKVRRANSLTEYWVSSEAFR